MIKLQYIELIDMNSKIWYMLPSQCT